MTFVDMDGSYLNSFINGTIRGIEQFNDADDIEHLTDSAEELADTLISIKENKILSLSLTGTKRDCVLFILNNYKLYDELMKDVGPIVLEVATCCENWLMGCLLDAALFGTVYQNIHEAFDGAVVSLRKELEKTKLFGKRKHDINALRDCTLRHLDYIVSPEAELMQMLGGRQDEINRLSDDIDALKRRLSSEIKWGRKGFDGDCEV